MKQDSQLSMDDLRLSELVDGELDRDGANALLLETLDDAEARERLKGLLRLRHVLAPWRRQEPRCVQVPVAPASGRSGSRSQAAGYAVAAAIGGLLVMGGFMLARSPGRDDPGHAKTPMVGRGQQDLSPETVHQMAQVFAFHESVGGPLKWYASDDQEVQLASFDGTRPPGEPVVVFLDLVGDDASNVGRRYMVVCRAGQQAAVDFPAGPGDLPAVRFQLLPSLRGGDINLRYVVDLRAKGDGQKQWVSLAGQNALGRKPLQLGVVVLHGHRFTIAASSGRLNPAQRG
jgi:hypothetical protein